MLVVVMVVVLVAVPVGGGVDGTPHVTPGRANETATRRSFSPSVRTMRSSVGAPVFGAIFTTCTPGSSAMVLPSRLSATVSPSTATFASTRSHPSGPTAWTTIVGVRWRASSSQATQSFCTHPGQLALAHVTSSVVAARSFPAPRSRWAESYEEKQSARAGRTSADAVRRTATRANSGFAGAVSHSANVSRRPSRKSMFAG
jgi:hypothetical protein